MSSAIEQTVRSFDYVKVITGCYISAGLVKYAQAYNRIILDHAMPGTDETEARDVPPQILSVMRFVRFSPVWKTANRSTAASG